MICWFMNYPAAVTEFLRPAGNLPSAVQLANAADPLTSVRVIGWAMHVVCMMFY